MNTVVYLKLINGDQLMATLLHDNDYAVVLSYPIALKSVPQMKEGMIYERLMTQEFCSFTDDKEFEFKKRDILLMKPLKESLCVLYQRTLDELYILQDNSIELEEVQDEQEEDPEELNKKLYH